MYIGPVYIKHSKHTHTQTHARTQTIINLTLHTQQEGQDEEGGSKDA